MWKSRMRRLNRHNKLRIETLETRQMMAGDACTLDTPKEIIMPPIEAFFAEETTFSQADAGSTRQTAARIGSIDGTRQLSGTLGWFDSSDVIGFSAARSGTVSVELSGLRRDADIYLTDATGTVLAQSIRPGRADDTVNVSVDSGEYFVWIVTQSFWHNRYQLSIETQLDALPINPVETSPVDNQDPPSSVTPLADVSYFGQSRDWNINAIGAPEAWASGYTGNGVTVAIVDTGVDLDHPDLRTNLFVNPGEIPGNGIDDDGNGFVDDVSGYDFADNDANANDESGHGTHVAGTIAAANNGFGATGIAPNATILPVRVLGANGSGSTLDVAAGIRYAANMGADIINLSLGGGYSRAIDSAIQYAKSVGALIVAAAGNESSSVPGYPARFSANSENVISVGAFNSSDRLARFSNDVGTSRSVQVDAPGVGIFSTSAGGGYATLSGTSMAAPHVAGLAALTLSANPNLTSIELRQLLAAGVQGQAVGSDALGKVSASSTVAYAAAGLKGTDLARANQSSLRPPSRSARLARATGIIDAILAPPPVFNHGKTDWAAEIVADESLPPHPSKPRLASFESISRETMTIVETMADSYFAAMEDEPINANTETPLTTLT